MKKLSSKDKTIHDQFSQYGKNAKEWMNKCILLLPQIEKNRIWEKKGFSCIYEYAAKLAGMSRNKVNEGLRILKKTENLPAIRKIIEEKGIFAVKPVVNIATLETDQLWAKRASEMTQRTLETFVRDFRKEQEEKSQERFNNEQNLYRLTAGSPINNGLNKPGIFQEGSGSLSEKGASHHDENSDSKIQVSMKLSLKIIDALKKIKGEGDWEQAMKKLLKYSQKELEAEQKCLDAKEKQFEEELKKEKPEAVKTNTHTVTTSVSNYIKKRSRGMCEHPNCNKPGKHIHHLEPFALKKEHDPDKLIYLCEEHHQIIHLGYIDDSRIVPEMEQIINSWKQIKKLPNYDIKNVINKRIAEFRQNHNSQQFIT